jgi:hypothetical protein
MTLHRDLSFPAGDKYGENVVVVPMHRGGLAGRQLDHVSGNPIVVKDLFSKGIRIRGGRRRSLCRQGQRSKQNGKKRDFHFVYLLAQIEPTRKR